MANDAKYMLRALELAKLAWGRTAPNPMVGAVIVRNGKIIGEGYHHAAGQPHAEPNAIRDALEHGRKLDGATLYVNLEPCSTYGRMPPCTRSILQTPIKNVVIGSLDPNPVHAGRGAAILRDAGLKVKTGVELAACEELNQPFFKWITTGKPWVMLKMAMTLDGRIATAAGESKYITGPEARERVQELRQLAGAILVGGRTMRLDRPSLTVRNVPDWPKQPKRFVASRTMTKAELAKLYGSEENLPEIVTLENRAGWEEFLGYLGKQEVLMLLIEGGGELAGQALAHGLVDMVEFHIAPKILGGNAAPVVGGALNPAKLLEAIELERVRTVRYGADTAISGYLKVRGR